MNPVIGTQLRSEQIQSCMDKHLAYRLLNNPVIAGYDLLSDPDAREFACRNLGLASTDWDMGLGKCVRFCQKFVTYRAETNLFLEHFINDYYIHFYTVALGRFLFPRIILRKRISLLDLENAFSNYLENIISIPDEWFGGKSAENEEIDEAIKEATRLDNFERFSLMFVRPTSNKGRDYAACIPLLGDFFVASYLVDEVLHHRIGYKIPRRRRIRNSWYGVMDDLYDQLAPVVQDSILAFADKKHDGGIFPMMAGIFCKSRQTSLFNILTMCLYNLVEDEFVLTSRKASCKLKVGSIYALLT